MLYAYVENGKVVEGPRSLPASWRNTSGLNLLSHEEVIKLGWRPWTFIETESPGADWVIGESVIEIKDTEIIETQTYRKKTQEEVIEEEKQRVESNRIYRTQAYREESDPLFFKAQRGEASMEEWLFKVNEIRQRYPV